MKILGETKPITHDEYKYRLIDQQKKEVKPSHWQIEKDGKILKTSKSGVFSFGLTLVNTNVILVAILPTNGKSVRYAITLSILAGKPKIISVQWKDRLGKTIGNRKVGYLDKITLAINTLNVPIGHTLKITVYEDENTWDRAMGSYTSSKIDKNGNAYLYFNNLQLYQTKLNGRDAIDESDHEYYVKIVYSHYLDEEWEKTQLVIQNDLVQILDKPKPTNKPVVVSKTTQNPNASSKNKVDVVFNMFFDGTLNNMTNTRARLERDTKGSDLEGVYYKVSNKKDDSFMNYYSNVALLYMNNEVDKTENIISIYTEGIGTRDKKGDQTSASATGDSISIPILPHDVSHLSDIKLFATGIKDKVKRGLAKMEEQANKKYFDNDKELGKVNINVFGFSRGAAAARHFMSKESEIKSALKLESKKDIQFNFIGLYDTVASFGVMHLNDVSDLNLDIGGKAKKVIQLAAADEYRSNFKLTDITGSIAAGVGYQLTMPGVHSDIGGGYGKWEIEERYLGEETTYSQDETPKKLEAIKKRYVEQGWYKEGQFIITKTIKSQFSKLGNHSFEYKNVLKGCRKLPNTYQYIPLAIMKYFCNKYGEMVFNDDKLKKNYDVIGDLVPIKKQLYDYAISHDSVRAYSVSLSTQDTKWIRNKYLHRSNKDDEIFTMSGRYVDGKPERDILIG